MPLVCLETAQPAKFADANREEIGREPARSTGYENIEAPTQRMQVIEPDAAAVKRYIAAHAV